MKGDRKMTPKEAYDILRKDGWNHHGALEIINALDFTEDGHLYITSRDELLRISEDYKDR